LGQRLILKIRQSLFQLVTMGNVHVLEFLEVSKQPFRLWRIPTITFQVGDDFALTSNVPFTCRHMATGQRKMFQEGGTVPDT
jgi:hypothetical protein